MPNSLYDRLNDFLDTFETANDDCVENTVFVPKVKCVSGVWEWTMEEEVPPGLVAKKPCPKCPPKKRPAKK